MSLLDSGPTPPRKGAPRHSARVPGKRRTMEASRVAATWKGREVCVPTRSVPRHCPKAIAPVRLHPHPCLMFPPATKQETSAGPWIHYVNKYTEDFRAFEGNRVLGRQPGPAQPGFLAEKRVQAAGQPGPA